MAGERLHPPGWTEISAVCTDAAYRGEGLATRLVRAVGAGIKSRGETPFLHVVATNTNAIRLYEQLGFVVRRRATFHAVHVPGLTYGVIATLPAACPRTNPRPYAPTRPHFPSRTLLSPMDSRWGQ